MPKARKSPGAGRDALRHNPLSEEYLPSNPKQKSGKRQKKRGEDSEEAKEHYIDSKASRKILDIGRDLQAEEENEQARRRPQPPPVVAPAFDFQSRLGEDDHDLEDDAQYDDENEWGDAEEEVEEVEIDENDAATFAKFFPSGEPQLAWPGSEQEELSGPGTDLAALILEKIAAHEATNPAPQQSPQQDDAVELPAKVVEVYTKIGLILARYKSGKLPKPFKILPTIPAWETLVSITRPDLWTPNAVFAATRIFVSGKPAVAQQFLNAVLLPAVQENIRETHKLNVHLYNALKKALYKPPAFFKGIVFPMLADGCTAREAVIVSSVVAKVSVPVLHSAAALHRLCEMAAEQMSSDVYAAGAVNIFLKVLVEKRYALPYKVVDALVFHFLRFKGTSRGDAMAIDDASVIGGEDRLPLIWHQCLLAFAQRYRNDITEDQREALLDLLLVKGHPAIWPEVRRELLEGRGRGVVVEPEAMGMGGDDTMVMG